MYLSKSKYCRLWQCPRMLWLDKNRPELAAKDAAAEYRMEEGNRVGDLAMGLFGDFVETTTLKENGEQDIAAMLEKTQQCLADGVENICEAAFSYGGLYCAVDILRKEKGGYAIYEVKSSTGPKEVYGVDIAYQKYVLERCGIHVTGTYLVHINNQYIRGEDLDIQSLFKIVDMTDWVALETPHLENRLAAAEKMLASSHEPVCELGLHCAEPYECAYWEHCSKHLPKPSVIDLRVKRGAGLKLYSPDVVTFEDALAKRKLNEKQKRQIRHTLTECEGEIDKEGIRDFLNTLSYPIYFLDFESIMPVIPPYPGTKPYQQIVFQYSLHYMETPDGELKHKEFLAQPGVDPNRDVAESLCRDIPMHACVTVYNKTFECARLKELAALFPDLAPHLLNIVSNIADFEDPFAKGYYYNRAMGPSSSIKLVLPALFPDDPSLNYHNLEGVHNGTEAQNIFPKMQYMSAEEAEVTRKNLLAYCKLDTYAMVKIWEKLQEAAK